MSGKAGLLSETLAMARAEAVAAERASGEEPVLWFEETGADDESDTAEPINADVPRVGERPGDDDGFVGMGPGVDYSSEPREI